MERELVAVAVKPVGGPEGTIQSNQDIELMDHTCREVYYANDSLIQQQWLRF